jgi:hypothetical protein
VDQCVIAKGAIRGITVRARLEECHLSSHDLQLPGKTFGRFIVGEDLIKVCLKLDKLQNFSRGLHGLVLSQESGAGVPFHADSNAALEANLDESGVLYSFWHLK